jgi:hypothetical protein
MPKRVALGFKVHTGWAMLVAVAGQPDGVEVLIRRRIELLPADESIPRFVYHKAAELPLSQAAELVKRAESQSQASSRLAIASVLKELAVRDARVNACGVLSGSTAVPDDLFRILQSHPLIHAAEGALFVEAIVSTCEERGMKTASVGDRAVWRHAAAAWGTGEKNLRKRIDDLRKSVGSPWNADHKLATAVALFALKANEAPEK